MAIKTNTSKRWSPSEDEILISSAKAGKRTAQVAKTLGRTMNAVSVRKYWFVKNGLIPSKSKFAHSPGTSVSKEVSMKTEPAVKVKSSTKAKASIKNIKSKKPTAATHSTVNFTIEELAKIAKSTNIKIIVLNA